MATLVLTAVGTALGGPVGGALGSLVGQSVDQSLLGGGPRKGPRLGDLSIQMSSYGSPVPRLYGTMRVAGSVIWATDLIEEEGIVGGGKGGPEAIAYRYNANFAVALSSRPIRSIKRIWADGRLIRGAAGDFKVRTDFRLLTGDDDQGVDPLIASVETIERTPAFRGLAVAVFENFDLGEFGNRIPMLTMEVEADERVSVGGLLADATGGVIRLADERRIGGYAAHGASVGDSVEGVIRAFGVQVRDEAGELVEGGAEEALVTGAMLGCAVDDEGAARIARTRAAARSIPDQIALHYYDSDRDYQSGQVRAGRPGGDTRSEVIELPAVLEAGEAKALAEEGLSRRWARGDILRLSLPPAFMTLQPGDRLRIADTVGTYRVDKLTIDGLAVRVEAIRDTGRAPRGVADGGRIVGQADRPIGRSIPRLIELPSMGEQMESAPAVFAMVGSAGDFKALPVEWSIDGGAPATVAVRRKAVIGTVEGALGIGADAIFDDVRELVVQLADPGQALLNADPAALASGANLAQIGRELVQFARADEMGPGRYRLSRLLRGRRGTEWAIPGHEPGEDFCLIDPHAMAPIPMTTDGLNQMVTATAHGIADRDLPPTASKRIDGDSMRPLSPCHLRAAVTTEGIALTWARRSVRGWQWLDGGDVPQDPSPARYRIEWEGASGSRFAETIETRFEIARDALPAGSAQPFVLTVRTVGDFMPSHPVTVCIVI